MEGPSPTTTTSVFPVLPLEIAFKIFSNLDHQSLLSSRLVSRGWCDSSSKFLQSRPTTILRLWCRSSLNDKESLSSFIKCFKQSMKFHHSLTQSKFILKETNGKDLKLSDLVQFFALADPSKSNFGSTLNPGLQITDLRLDRIQACPTILLNLETLLFERTPHLRKLSLSFSRYISTENRYSDINGARPCYSSTALSKLLLLQALQLYDCVGAATIKFVYNIIKAAPSIQVVEGTDFSGFKGHHYRIFHPDHLQVLIEAKKLYLVKQCSIRPYEELVVSGLLIREKLTQGQFQPKILDLQHLVRSSDPESDWIRNLEQTKRALEEIVWSIKDAVEDLRTDDSLGLLELPEFSKLRRLHWTLHNGDYPILPSGIRARSRNVFPFVDTISFSFYFSESANYAGIFPEMSYIPDLPLVENLEIQLRGQFTQNFFESIMIMCPNLRSFSISYFEYSQPHSSWMNPNFWASMRGLCVLVLNNINIANERPVEAWFTGFSLETIHQLAYTRPTVEIANFSRINPSILQLKELKTLVIKREGEEYPRLNPLEMTFKYAFNLMPGLTVDIC